MSHYTILISYKHICMNMFRILRIGKLKIYRHVQNIYLLFSLNKLHATVTSVYGFFINIKSFRSHYGSGIDSASIRNEYQEHFLGVKEAGA